MVKRKKKIGMNKEDTTMKKNILSMAALLIASAAVFTACSSDDNITSELPANPTGKYTMTINASKGGDATTRALTPGRNDADTKNVLNATWATTENVYVKKESTWATGSLQPEADGATATLKGSLSDIEINASDVLTLQFPNSGTISYAGQVGTLEDIAANFDYATATVTVADVSATGNIIPEEATTTFTNQQAIVKFTLIDKADGSTSLSATQLVINDGTTDYTITPASATSEIYAAIPGFTGQTVTLTATVGDDTYTYEKTDVSFTNGQYYEITVKMTKQGGAAEGHALSASAVGEIVGSDGKAYAVADKDNLPSGVTAVAMVAYKSANAGESLAIALSDEDGEMNWSLAKSTCESKDAIGGISWKLPSKAEWNQMFGAEVNADQANYTDLNTAITNAGGTALHDDEVQFAYWSSTPGDELAWLVVFDAGVAEWVDFAGSGFLARAVLAF